MKNCRGAWWSASTWQEMCGRRIWFAQSWRGHWASRSHWQPTSRFLDSMRRSLSINWWETRRSCSPTASLGRTSANVGSDRGSSTSCQKAKTTGKRNHQGEWLPPRAPGATATRDRLPLPDRMCQLPDDSGPGACQPQLGLRDSPSAQRTTEYDQKESAPQPCRTSRMYFS